MCACVFLPEMENIITLSLLLFQAGVIEEIVNDAVDTALDSEDIEEEIEEEVDRVLTEIAGETAAQLPEAVRKEKLKEPAQALGDAEVCHIYKPLHRSLIDLFNDEINAGC